MSDMCIREGQEAYGSQGDDSWYRHTHLLYSYSGKEGRKEKGEENYQQKLCTEHLKSNLQASNLKIALYSKNEIRTMKKVGFPFP